MFLFPILINIMISMILTLPSKNKNFHPITLMIYLIFLTMMICLKINFIYYSMITFILFLTMIGGLMIIFMYITSLANNEKFSFNLNFIMLKSIKFLIFLILFIFLFIILFQNYMYLNYLNNLNKEIINNLNFFFMYKELTYKSSIFLMIYLYFTMICIMNICNKFMIPLRQILF